MKRRRPAGKNERGAPVRTVRTPIPVKGLEGDVSVVSISEHDLLGIVHRIQYASETGAERVSFKFSSVLALSGDAYEGSSGSSDSVSTDRRTWTHVGFTETGSSSPRSGHAFVDIGNGSPDGSGSTVTYWLSADYPYSDPYEGHLDVPFS